MKEQHTPGPWRIGDAGHTVFGPPNGNPSPKTIARDTIKSDARLIAAAPELLKALVDVLAADGDLNAMDFKMYRAAIAKAQGETT